MVKIKVCPSAQIPPGNMENFNLLEHTVLVANVNGRYYAMDGMCSDAGGNLSRGKLFGTTVECPRHAARFDLTTGKMIQPPNIASGRRLDLRAYPVTVENDCLIVDL